MSLRIGGLNLGNSGTGNTGGSGGNTTPTNGYGFIRYFDSQYTSSSPQSIPANVDTMLFNNGMLYQNDQANLTIPYTHNFLQGNRFWPASAGDTYLLRLSFTASSNITSNQVTVSLSIPALVQQETTFFPVSAQEATKFTFNFNVFALDTFHMNGGAFMVESDYDMTVWECGLLVIPVTLK